MTHPSNQYRPIAIVTNGENQVCTSHLNLTRSLADVAAEPRKPTPKFVDRDWYEKASFAGKDTA
jgi:hypothetical protein